jgi:hypothetical protein
MTLLQKLKEWYETDPTDPFNGYAYAIEWIKTDHKEAITLLITLTSSYPFYVPTYQTLAAKLYDSNNTEEAITSLTDGIAKVEMLLSQSQYPFGQSRSQLEKALLEMKSTLFNWELES